TPELSSFLKRCNLGMDNQMEAVYTLFLVTLLYIVPMVIIGIFYLIISHHLWNVRVPGSVVRNT
ncbi:orexin receptor type 1, partial [Biomphalaria pfeifferi]